MVQSMTGFGKASSGTGRHKISVELRSLNSKQFELYSKLPSPYKEKENVLRALLAKELRRGKVDLTVIIEDTVESGSYRLDRKRTKYYLNELRYLAKISGDKGGHLIDAILRFPDVITPVQQISGALRWKDVQAEVCKAVRDLVAFRIMEGRVLEKDLEKRIRNIINYMTEIKEMEITRTDSIREKILHRLSNFIEEVKIDRNRLEQEIIYYVERMDITEERVRLGSHCDYFLQTLKEKYSNGKKLGFIAQEIGREINTIGAKAGDAGIQKLVVIMKDELEKAREQLMNVL